MTTPTNARFDDLLSTRARIGWGASVPPARPVAEAALRVRRRPPRPGLVPLRRHGRGHPDDEDAEGAAALSYGEPQGYRGLRELVCHKYRFFENLEVTPENIIVANGSGAALSLAFSAFVDVGDPMLIEAPTFSGSLATDPPPRPRVLDVPVDGGRHGHRRSARALEKIRREGRRCKLIYTIVNFQNPAGPDLSIGRRQELIELAEEYDTLILEDDAYDELRFEGDSNPSVYALDSGGRVIRAGTLSKILGAGVRLGWLCAPPAMIPAFQGFIFGGGVNPFMSRVATFYLRDHMEAHVKGLVDVYRAKRDAMLRGLWEVLKGTDVEISRPQGGFFIWIKLPSATNVAKLEELAVQARVQYTPGRAFFAGKGGERHIRLAFSYEQPDKCYEGSRILAKAILDAGRA